MVVTLANQLIACFDKQTESIKVELDCITEALVQNVPKIVAQEFQKILSTNGNVGLQAELVNVDEGVEQSTTNAEENRNEEEHTYVASGAIESLICEEDNDDDDILFFENYLNDSGSDDKQ